MIYDIAIISHTGKYDLESNEVSITYHAYTDDWRDGPLAIAQKGTSSVIVDDLGDVQGWLRPGTPYQFANEIDLNIIASEVDVSERTVIKGDDKYDLRISGKNIQLARNLYREAEIRWTVRQTFKMRSRINQKPKDEPSVDDNFTYDASKETYEVPFVRDAISGKLILNSAGDPFIPTPTTKKVIRCFALARKERINRVKFYEQYENVVNADSWYGAPPETILMESIIPKWDGSLFNVTYSYKYKEDGWREKYLDTGYRKRDESGVYPILSDSGTQIESPARLDGKGWTIEEMDSPGFDVPEEGAMKYRALPLAPLLIPNPYTVNRIEYQ